MRNDQHGFDDSKAIEILIKHKIHNWSLSSFLAKSAQKLTAYTSHYTVFHVKERSAGGWKKVKHKNKV